MSSLYAAAPLTLSGNSTNIRLVEILPGHGDEQIACRMHVAVLDKNTEYTALSYVWGDETLTKKIKINGKTFTIRGNLWDFLHEARRSEFKTCLWIDAICIDQTADEERSHQVAMMGDIYSNAGNVVVWLGLRSKSIARAVS